MPVHEKVLRSPEDKAGYKEGQTVPERPGPGERAKKMSLANNFATEQLSKVNSSDLASLETAGLAMALQECARPPRLGRTLETAAPATSVSTRRSLTRGTASPSLPLFLTSQTLRRSWPVSRWKEPASGRSLQVTLSLSFSVSNILYAQINLKLPLFCSYFFMFR